MQEIYINILIFEDFKMPLFFSIKVVPSSLKQCAVLDKGGFIKIYLKNPPENGKANRELIRFLSNSLKIPQNLIMLVSGLNSRNKKIKINIDISLDAVFSLLDIPIQKKLV